MASKPPQLMKLLSTQIFQFCALKFGCVAHLNRYSIQENMSRWKITLLIMERDIKLMTSLRWL